MCCSEVRLSSLGDLQVGWSPELGAAQEEAEVGRAAEEASHTPVNNTFITLDYNSEFWKSTKERKPLYYKLSMFILFLNL